ncbi:MAG: hypothetical protein QOE77_2147 [Blastocatellia bacterium]|jgi:glycosyltransferase involved in cell wall biosynthesis|nr:hypothetical protein [Blastocatellia bacterium]
MPKLAVLNTHPIQYFAPLYRRLAQEPDLDLTVYFCSRQGLDEYLDEGFGARFKWDTSLLEGYRHKFLPNLRRRDQVTGFLSLINPSIIRELRQNGYDALLVNGHNHATYVIAMLAAKLFRLPVFMRCETHLHLQRSTVKRAIRKSLMSFFYKHVSDACLAIGTRNREFYEFHGVANEKIFPVPYAVDNVAFMRAAQNYDKKRLRAELGLPVAKPVILFAAKITKQKRPHDLLLAYQQLRKRGRDAALVFVGSGPEEQSLKDVVGMSGIPDVHFFGFRNQGELSRFYAAADIFVLPSSNESWGLALNEAMCAALPLIASEEIGAVADLVQHGKNGFAFQAGNVAAMSDYLSQLVDDPDLRVRMGSESLRIIKQWDYEACVGGIKNALAHMASSCERLPEEQAA